jgi:DNA-binding protein HU-beta
MKFNEEFIVQVAKEAGATQKQTKEVVRATVEVICQVMAAGSEVTIPNLGRFKAELRAGKSGTTPTGQKYTAQDKMVPKFRAAKNLKESAASGKVK